GHVTDTHIDFSGVEHFHESLANRVRSKMSQPGDTIITTKGNSTGRTSYVTDRLPPFVYSPHLSYWRSRDPDRLQGGFLRYWSRGAEFERQLSGMKTSTDMAPYLSLTDQRRLRITLPPVHEQKTIAHILGTLDDKIELNRRMNATLEAMARALFQSWFVDFDPVRAKLDGRPPAGLDEATAALFPAHFQDSEDGKLPIGWRRASINELCNINSWTLSRNDDLETLEYVEISEVNRGNIANIVTYQRGEEPSRARRRLRHGDTVLSTVRPDRGSYFLALNPPENRLASTGFAVLTPTKALWAFIHAAMTQPEVSDHLGQMADGGAYPAVRPEIIGAWEVAVPDHAGIFSAFQRICASLFEQAEANRIQSCTLATLRDTLLPKLLSGELRVAEMQATMSAASSGTDG
ncbi:MAG: restriction endonuclease subunit S, partial [Blastocatellia bacterium]